MCRSSNDAASGNMIDEELMLWRLKASEPEARQHD
jgi:hypothetical protein